MSTATNERVPQLTLGWRLKMALADSDLSRDEIAQELGVTPSTISRWMSDKGAPPARAFILHWSRVTHVPATWLEHGVVTADDPDPGVPDDEDDERDPVSELARRKRERMRPKTTGRYLPRDVAA